MKKGSKVKVSTGDYRGLDGYIIADLRGIENFYPLKVKLLNGKCNDYYESQLKEVEKPKQINL